MNISDEVRVLNENKLLRTNDEIEKFKCAINKILSNQDYKDIKYLCTGFEDNTENNEVMFEIVHAIESYNHIVDVKLYLTEFIYSIPEVYSYAKQWLKIMSIRILDDKSMLNEYIQVSKNCDNSLKVLLIELMEEAKKENPQKYSRPANKFITCVK